MFKPNTIIQGDCLKVLSEFPKGSVDLIYLDPPFFSKKDYDMPFGDKNSIKMFQDSVQSFTEKKKEEYRAFLDSEDPSIVNKYLKKEGFVGFGTFMHVSKIKLAEDERKHTDFWQDRQGEGLLEYLRYMRDRLWHCHRVLKKTGSIYLHCDWHASHYLKIIMDEIFGMDNFRNEMIVKRPSKNLMGQFKKGITSLNVAHDSVFWYSKDKNIRFNPHLKEASDKQKEGSWAGLYNNADRPTMRYKILGCTIIKGQWKRGKERAFKAVENYQIYLKNHSNKPLKQYWIETGKKLEFIRKKPNQKYPYYWVWPVDEKICDSNWMDIPTLESGSIKLRYPTQKSEKLLERIIKASSNEGDIVMDPFCGCGTTIAVAARLKRKVIGIDISPQACKVMKERLRKNENINLTVDRFKLEEKDIKEMGWFQFQQWACDRLKCVPGGKGADGGIDGEGEIKEGDDIIPLIVQAKHWQNACGAPTVRKFFGTLANKNTPYGIIVANAFSRDAIQQARDYSTKNKTYIWLITSKQLSSNDFDIERILKKKVIAPQYAPWRKEEIELTEWTGGKLLK